MSALRKFIHYYQPYKTVFFLDLFCATFISVVVALFVLVIVNSAVIAGLNSELAAIESGVASARETLQNVTAQIDFATSAENIADYALSHGMYLL